MTVSSPTRSQTFAGNLEAPATLPLSFTFHDAEDLVVTRIVGDVETVLTLGEDYTVTGGGGETGSVTMLVVPGGTIRVERTVAFTQGLELSQQGPLSAELLERELDRCAMRDQQQQDLLDDVDSRVTLVEGNLAGLEAAVSALEGGGGGGGAVTAAAVSVTPSEQVGGFSDLEGALSWIGGRTNEAWSLLFESLSGALVDTESAQTLSNKTIQYLGVERIGFTGLYQSNDLPVLAAPSLYFVGDTEHRPAFYDGTQHVYFATRPEVDALESSVSALETAALGGAYSNPGTTRYAVVPAVEFRTTAPTDIHNVFAAVGDEESASLARLALGSPSSGFGTSAYAVARLPAGATITAVHLNCYSKSSFTPGPTITLSAQLIDAGQDAEPETYVASHTYALAANQPRAWRAATLGAGPFVVPPAGILLFYVLIGPTAGNVDALAVWAIRISYTL